MDVSADLICIECAGSLNKLSSGSVTVLACNCCTAVYPVIESIYIMLCTTDAFYEREEAFVVQNQEALLSLNLLHRFEERLVIAKKHSAGKTWEKEDVEHWDAIYSKNTPPNAKDVFPLSNPPQFRSLRANQVFFNTIRNKKTLSPVFKLMEIGCGTGNAVLTCFNPYYENYSYIGSDYSFSALKYLGQVYKEVSNVTLIQCAGNKIPFSNDYLDVILALGILHHMPKKENEFKAIFPKIKKSGYFMTHEAFAKEKSLPRTVQKIYGYWIEPDSSAHEERINLQNFMQLAGEYGTLEHVKYEHTPALTLLLKLFGRYTSKYLVTRLFFFIDDIVAATLGKLSGLMSPGGVYAIVRKDS